jgi:YtkA-like
LLHHAERWVSCCWARAQTVAGVTLRLEVTPAAFGPNRLLLALRDAHNRPVQGAPVQFALDLTDMPMDTTTLQALPVGGGRYQVLPRLTMPGHWRPSSH